MIAPAAGVNTPSFGVLEIGAVAGAVALFLLVFIRRMRGAAPVPLSDPYLVESLNYHS